jgi:hypothetical protein
MEQTELFSQFFFVGVDVLSTTIHPTTKAILAQTGDATKSVVESDGVEWWQTAGVSSRAAKAVAGKAACQAIGLKRGSRDIIFATRDLRSSTIYGALKEGETCVYATTGQARLLFKADGSQEALTTDDNTTSGVTMTKYFGPDGFRLTLPWGQMSFDKNGFMVSVEGGGALIITPDGKAKLMATKVSVEGSLVAVSGSVKTVLGPKAAIVPRIGALFGLSSPGGSAAAPAVASSNVVISV